MWHSLQNLGVNHWYQADFLSNAVHVTETYATDEHLQWLANSRTSREQGELRASIDHVGIFAKKKKIFSHMTNI